MFDWSDSTSIPMHLTFGFLYLCKPQQLQPDEDLGLLLGQFQGCKRWSVVVLRVESCSLLIFSNVVCPKPNHHCFAILAPGIIGHINGIVLKLVSCHCQDFSLLSSVMFQQLLQVLCYIVRRHSEADHSLRMCRAEQKISLLL